MKLKWIIAIGFCVLLAAVGIPLMFVNQELPQKLHGKWETDEVRYVKRHFLLDKKAIGFDTGNGYVDWYHITRVVESSRDDNTIYSIDYESNDGAVFKRSIIYNSGDGIYNSSDGPTIRFENQADIEWFPVNR